jgi:hypothetical protein
MKNAAGGGEICPKKVGVECGTAGSARNGREKTGIPWALLELHVRVASCVRFEFGTWQSSGSNAMP